MSGASVTKSTEFFGIARSTVSKVMTSFEKENKTSSLKQSSGRKQKLFHRDRWTLTRFVRKDNKTTALKITAELNDHLKKPVSSVRRGLHKARFHRRAAIRKPYYENKFLWNSKVSSFFVTPLYSQEIMWDDNTIRLFLFRPQRTQCTKSRYFSDRPCIDIFLPPNLSFSLTHSFYLSQKIKVDCIMWILIQSMLL